MTKELHPLLETAIAELKAAALTLEGMGYTWNGGEQWKPPLGRPDALRREWPTVTVPSPGYVNVPAGAVALDLADQAADWVKRLERLDPYPIEDLKKFVALFARN